MKEQNEDLSNEELDEIANVIYLHHGYDFKNYARASFRRRVIRCMHIAGIKTGFDLRLQLINDKDFFGWFLQSITVNVTEMFRDPSSYRELREKIMPKLASYPTIKIWHAGCSTGEEVFSMAILLREEGLLDRTRIYATDLNPANLKKAQKGIVPLNQMKDYTFNYIQSGGQNDFSAYYTARYDYAIIHNDLRRNMLFSQHNLVSGQAFNEFQLICCRNVLIYFNKDLQSRVIRLFHDSLPPLGYLAIGMKESLLFSDIRHQFDVVSQDSKIFRRKM